MKILIAEDDVVQRRVLEVALARWEHDLKVAVDGEAALAALTAHDAPPLAIIDVMMPGIDGFEVCRRVRAANLGVVSPYIILLTAKSEREEVVAGLTAGADDYLIKPYNINELRARLNSGVRIVELQQTLAERVRQLEETNNRLRLAEAELLNLSLTDDLTNLSNRRGFFALAAQAQRVANRTSQNSLLFYFDMDGLKRINDEHGHHEGSRSLVGIADCLQRTFRTSDILARLGGDEFAAFVINANDDAAEMLTERLRAALGDETVNGNFRQPLSVSVGYVSIQPLPKISLTELLNIADERMYEQKKREKKLRMDN